MSSRADIAPLARFVSRSARALIPCVLALALLGGPMCSPRAAAASPGNAFLVLQPAPGSGDFDADAFLGDPPGFSARALEHPDGWAIAYTSEMPPAGWTRPFLMRGGGLAGDGNDLHPRYSLGIDELLATRHAAMVALLAAPDTAACAPGKPNPHPLYRDGWLFSHDGVIDIAAAATGIWDAAWGPDWDAFRVAHPRDYDGGGNSTRGNASEIYFLALLFEIARAPNIPAAFLQTLLHFSHLPEWEAMSLNAILQGVDATWVLRWTGSDAQRYRIFYTRTTTGEYCITDSLPPYGAGWQEIPNATLAYFPFSGEVELLPIDLASGLADPGACDPSGDRTPANDPAWDDPRDARDDALRGPQLALSPAVTTGGLALHCRIPVRSSGELEICDLQGRRLARLALSGGAHEIRWTAPRNVPSGMLWAHLRADETVVTARALLLR
jgi:hypothetical protein